MLMNSLFCTRGQKRKSEHKGEGNAAKIPKKSRSRETQTRNDPPTVSERRGKTAHMKGNNNEAGPDTKIGNNTWESSIRGGTVTESIPKGYGQANEQQNSNIAIKVEGNEEQEDMKNTEASTDLRTTSEQALRDCGTYAEHPLLHIQNTRRHLEILRVQLTTVVSHIDNARKDNENGRREIEISRREIEESRNQLSAFQSQLGEYSEQLGEVERAFTGEKKHS